MNKRETSKLAGVKLRNKETNIIRLPTNIDELIMGKVFDEHLPKRRVVMWLMEEYGVAQRTAYQHIEGMYKKINDLSKENFETSYTDVIMKYEELYTKAVDKGDLKTARAILADVAKIKGVFIERVNNEHSIINIQYVTPPSINE